jgi:hypothetical protein
LSAAAAEAEVCACAAKANPIAQMANTIIFFIFVGLLLLS